MAVFGDELIEKGDPLGEMIALALKSDDQDDVLWERIQAYHREHFAGVQLTPRWKHGLIEALRVGSPDGHDAMEKLTRSPAIRFLQKLELDIQNVEVGNSDPIPIMLERGLPSTLREVILMLREGKSDISALYPLIPNIERFAIWRPKALGTMDLPQLKWLRVVEFDASTYAELSKAKLPLLETLVIEANPLTEMAGFELLHAPRLETLVVPRPKATVWRGGRQDAEWSAFLDAPIAKQARKLHFPDPLADLLEALPKHVSKLAHFEEVQMKKCSLEVRNAVEAAVGDRLVWL